MDTVLIVEDDPRIQRALERQFVAEGYAVRVVADGVEALEVFRVVSPCAVVLDLMLPGLSGREVCKRLKASAAEVPVIILSAISEVADKVLLLELGADDYVTKPFSPRELLARVQAAIRRNRRLPPSVRTQFGTAVVNFDSMEVSLDGSPVTLTAHEFKLLKYFIEHAGRVISREQLLSDVWGYDYHLTTRTVDNQVLKLRQKLEKDPAEPVHFRTVHGVGYKFLVAG